MSRVRCCCGTFFSASRACAVGSTQDEFPGRQGQALCVRSASVERTWKYEAARMAKLDSEPAVRNSQCRPIRNPWSYTFRTQHTVSARAVTQVAEPTCAAGLQPPSASCHGPISAQALSDATAPSFVPCSANIAYAVGSSQDDFPGKYPHPPSAFWTRSRNSRRDSRYGDATTLHIGPFEAYFNGCARAFMRD